MYENPRGHAPYPPLPTPMVGLRPWGRINTLCCK